MANILVFGDSITQGYWDLEGGWVQRLRRYSDEKSLKDRKFPTTEDYWNSIYNLGRSGNTSQDLLKRFDFETKQRIDEGEETVIIVAIGANDALWIQEKKSFQVKPEVYKQNLKKIIKISRKYSSKIFFVGLTTVDNSRTDPLPWAPEYSSKSDHVKEYDKLLLAVCKENKTPYIEMFDKLKTSDLEDGDHPNGKGHQKIFEVVKDRLLKEKLI